MVSVIGIELYYGNLWLLVEHIFMITDVVL